MLTFSSPSGDQACSCEVNRVIYHAMKRTPRVLEKIMGFASASAPRQARCGADVDDCHTGLDCSRRPFAEPPCRVMGTPVAASIRAIRFRSRRFSRLAAHHRRDKPVHIPDSRRQDTNLGGLCKLPRPGGRCEDKQALRDRVVNFGPSADIPSSPLTPRSELIARTSPSIWVNAARGDEHARQ